MSIGKAALWIDGGMGKVIASTACIEKLSAKYEHKLIVVSGYPDVLVNNPHVYRNFGHMHPYLHEDYLGDISVIKRDPYLIDEYRLQRKHLIECYCKVFDIEYDKTMKPEIFLSQQEENEIHKHKESGEFAGRYIVLHMQGGCTYYSANQALNKIVKSRDWPTVLAQKFVDLFKKKYPNIKIVQIGLNTEPILQGVIIKNNLPPRLIYPIVKYCDSFVCIDSIVNHLSAAFNKKGVVLFGGTDAKRLGYDQNDNMVADCGCPPCHISDYKSHLGGQFDCKYNCICMKHDPELVLDRLSKFI